MGYYDQFLTKGLIIYALAQNSTYFMEVALNQQAFDSKDFREPMIIRKLIDMFIEDGSKTNLILNVFLLTDIATWRPPFLEQLLGIFDDYLEGN